MAIPVLKKPEDVIFGSIELCLFCGFPTQYWHENTNNPVCPYCAKTHKVRELPDYGQRIRANKKKKSLTSKGVGDD